LGETEEADSLAEDIAESRGVFLRVFLVTKLLREGLTNGDSYTAIQRRPETFPDELEPFFRHMLDSLDPLYRGKTPRSLLVAMAAKTLLDLIIYNC